MAQGSLITAHQGFFILERKVNLMIAASILVGFVLGVTFGWALLIFLVLFDLQPKRPPTKDEWKVM